VDETGLGVGGDQHAEAGGDLVVVGGGEGADEEGHGADHVVAGARAADAFAGIAVEEVGVVFAPDEAPRVEVDGIVGGHVAEVSHGQKAGHIGVVHHQAVAEAVHLVGVDAAVDGVLHGGVAAQCLLHLVGQGLAGVGRLRVLIHFAQDLGCLTERTDGEEIRGDDEGQCHRVVRGAEGGGDQSDGAHGAEAVMVHERVGGVGIRAVLALLFTEGAEDELHDFLPSPVGEDALVARLLPVGIS